jgi:polysaccharide biosynthesis protein PslH
MNILFLTPRLPYPPVQGDRVRAFRLLQYLSKWHSVKLVTFLEREKDRQYLGRINSMCANLYTVMLPPWRSYYNCGVNIFRNIPMQVAYYRSIEYRKLIESIIAESNIDLIHTHLLRMVPYSINIRGIPKVLDMTDAISLYLSRFADSEKNIMKRSAIIIERNRIVNYERFIAGYEKILVCSQKDSNYLQERYNFRNLEVIYNCVDINTLRMGEDVEMIPNSMIFSGNFSYPPNADAAQHLVRTLFPRILEKYPQAKLLLVGRNPRKEILRYNSPNITVTGYVDDINIWYKKATVAISPVRFGAGTLNKVLEPMALGKLVVATPIGVEGLNLRDGKDILFSYNDDEFVERTVQALQNESLRSQIGKQAHETVRERFRCEAIARKVSDIYENILNKER